MGSSSIELNLTNYYENWASASVIGGVGDSAFAIYGIKTDGTLWAWGDNGNYYYLWSSNNAYKTDSPVQLGTHSNWAKVSPGNLHAMAIKTDGTLWGWGYSYFGSIGNGSQFTGYSSPVQVGTLNDWKEVNAGNYFTTATKTDGTLWSWGYANSGVLGLNDGTNRSSPVQIGTLNNWSKVFTGALQTMAIKTDGTLWSWGYNNVGQLGSNNTITRSSPVQVGTLNTWSDISISFANSSHVAAVRTNGTLWTWGNNDFGQLGSNNITNRSSPVQVGTLTNWSKVFTGPSHTMAIKTDGTLWAWGKNTYGYFGNGQLISRSSPVQIGVLNNWSTLTIGRGNDFNLFTNVINTSNNMYSAGFWPYIARTVHYSSPVQIGIDTDWSKIAAGGQYSMGIKTTNALWGFGDNQRGQLGNSNTTRTYIPLRIGFASDWSSVYAGTDHTMAIKTTGTLWSWGYNDFGQLGTNNGTTRSSPVQVGTLNTWTNVSLDKYISAALRNDNTLWLWGRSDAGHYSNGDTTSTQRSSPVQIGTPKSWKQVSIQSLAMVALDDSGGLFTNGTETDIRLGYSFTNSSAVQIGNKTNWISVSCGQSHTMAISGSNDSGTLWAWGYNLYGQIGNNNVSKIISPVQIGTLNDWSKIDCNKDTTLAIKSNGTLWAWGRNDSGQLGIRTNTNRSSPVQVGTLSNWSQVSIGISGAVASVKSNNTLWTWGYDSAGILASNVSISAFRSSPVQVGTLSNWSQVSVSQHSMAAIKTDGTLWSWGNNQYGQLGLADVTTRSSPVQVGTLSNWKYVLARYYKTFALKTDGTLWSWGIGQNSDSGRHRNIHILNPVETSKSFTEISSYGPGGSIAISTDGTLWAWGRNGSGQLGLSDIVTRSSPVQVGTLSNWSQISAGFDHTIAIKTDGTLWAWGSNTSGKLGLGDTVNRSSPVQVGTLSNWSQISAAVSHVMAIKTDGTLWSWGENDFGKLGLGDTVNRSSPVQVGTLSNWSSSSLGDKITIAIKTDGSLWSWGRNNTYGQLGLGDMVTRSSPVQVGTLRNWSKIACSKDHTIAIKTDGTLWTWGDNQLGNLGLGDKSARSSPVQVGTLSNWSTPFGSCASYDGCSFVIKTDGTLWSWGYSNYRFGSVSTPSRSSPVQIGTRTDFVSGSVSEYTGVSINNNGILYSWGDSTQGNLGYDINFTINRSSPVQIGKETDWKHIFGNQDNSGYDIIFAMKTDGTLWGWGKTDFGQLGLVNTIIQSVPMQVLSEYNWLSGSNGASHTVLIRT